jgi:hypothetical protein
MPAAELDLAAAVLDVGGVVFGEELDLRRVAFETIMIFKSGQQDFADQPRHLALLGRLHRQDDADRLVGGRLIHIKRARPPGWRHLCVFYLIIGQARGAAEAQDQLVMVMRFVAWLGNRLEPFFFRNVSRRSFCGRLRIGSRGHRASRNSPMPATRSGNGAPDTGLTPLRAACLHRKQGKRMPLGVPTLADRQYTIGDRDRRTEIAVPRHFCYLRAKAISLSIAGEARHGEGRSRVQRACLLRAAPRR